MIVFLFQALALYRLFEEVDHWRAAVMVILVLVQIPAALVDALSQLATAVLLHGPDYLAVFDKPQRKALAMLLVSVSQQGAASPDLLKGLWLLPLGALVYRSRFFPACRVRG